MIKFNEDGSINVEEDNANIDEDPDYDEAVLNQKPIFGHKKHKEAPHKEAPHMSDENENPDNDDENVIHVEPVFGEKKTKNAAPPGKDYDDGEEDNDEIDDEDAYAEQINKKKSRFDEKRSEAGAAPHKETVDEIFARHLKWLEGYYSRLDLSITNC